MNKFTLNNLQKSWYPKQWISGFLVLFLLMGTVATAQTVTLGSGTAETNEADYLDLGPVSSYYAYTHYQVVYTAAEITAAGGVAGLVSQFGWNVSLAPDVVLPAYTIKMALTTATDAATHNTTPLTQVYSGDFTAVTGYNMFTLTTPFVWDGTSNILIDVCNGAADFEDTYGTTFVYGTAENSSRYAVSDGTSQCSVETEVVNTFKPQARFVLTTPPSCLNPASAGATAVTQNTATINWAAPVLGTPAGYEYVVSTTNTAPTGAGTAATGTSAAIANLTASTTYYVFVRSACGADGFSTWTQGSFTTDCISPVLTVTAPEAICGQGSIDLVSDSTGFVYWYNAAVGGSIIASGETFTTPLLTQNATYYVGASSSALQTAGAVYSGTETNGDSTGNHGIAVTTTAPNVTVMSAEIPFTGTGTFTVELWDANENVVTSVTTETVTGNGATPVAVPLNLTIPAAGDYYIILSEITGDIYDLGYSEETFPFETEDGSLSVTSGYWYGEDITNMYFYNLLIGSNVCLSPRQAVAVTVNPATPVTTAVTNALICEGASTQISATSTNAGYAYVWMPGNLTGATQTVSPTATTQYTVTATDATTGCVAVATVTVTVNALPSDLDVTEDAEVCANGNAVALTVTGGVTNNVILSEGFNAATNNWTKINNSTGGDIIEAAWTLRPDGYEYSFDPFESNDNTQFYLTNSDAQGYEGITTSTILQSPAFSTVGYTSANVSFYQFLYEPSSGTTATVEVSTNGTTWAALATYDETVGELDAFEQSTVALTAAYLNQPTVYVRFKYDSEYRYYWAIDNVSVQGEQSASFTWAPVAGLFTDAAATTPYTGTATATVYAKPDADATYTVTASNVAGCSVTATTAVTVITTDAPEVTAAQTFCNAATVANLSAAGGINVQWYAAATGGTALTAATALTATTYYASQTVNGCESADRTAVVVTITAVVADAPADVTECDAYTLPALTNGAYYTAANGGGTAIAVGTEITETSTIYVFAASGDCTAQNTFTVTINSAAAPTGAATQTITVTGGEEATLADIEVTATGTVNWYATEADALAGTNALPLTTVVTAGTTYYATQTIGNCTSVTAFAVTVSAILGNAEFNSRAFAYYPNPVNNVLTVEYSSDITAVSVFNVLGQQMLSAKPNATNAAIDMSALAQGTYMVNVTVGTTVKTIKVIKN